MEPLPNWLLWARELQAVAQSGLTFCQNPYDRERYEAMRVLAAKMMAEGTGADPAAVEKLFVSETGYATPKLDVRAALFRNGEVLLVSELIDGGRWTLPGGWADVNESPSENAVREMREEAGLIVTAKKLAMVMDRDRAGHPMPYPFHIYKLFFLCDAVAECAKKDGETGEARFFPVEALPELSEARVLPQQIRRLYRHWQEPALPTDFN
jgi:ADP-ribose pyrophosphatase YjhB (NUDIX family)